uniref:Reverse transcriptase domain-containing protein n=1 Tax=Salarias fasciatus TaxID=181472 RepID=A0A672GUJ2_SALFA
MNMSLIKQITDVVIEPFKYICNLSFTTGTFPESMKIAKVIPLFKKGNKNDVSNYRPISLLPQLSKILEKLFVIRLNKFIVKHNILSNNQYGFRTNHSTATAIMELAEEITNAMDKKRFLVSVFVDLQKAFDTLDHDILLYKLYKYGIRGVAHEWVKSYLKDRKQFVQINDIKSKNGNVTCGVPQGSVLGPVLFLLYINGIDTASSLLKCILFADDTTLYYAGDNINEVLEIVEKEFQNVIKWFNANKLSLNISKTKYMIFSYRRTDVDTTLTVEGIEIERTNEIKFLGVLLDEQLTWKSHIDYVKTKISQTIAVLYKLKESLHNNSLFLLYNSLIIPYLTYCVEVWGNACKTYIEPLFLLQKRAIRVVNGSGYRDHTNPIFIKLKSLKMKELVELNLLKTMYKAHRKKLPFNLQNRFAKRDSQYRLRGTEVFKRPESRTKLKERCITTKGINLWNKLDSEIKRSQSIHIFKKCLKAQLLGGYDS